MATSAEYDAAIARVKNSPETASEADFELTKRMARESGPQARAAQRALGDNSNNWGV